MSLETCRSTTHHYAIWRSLRIPHLFRTSHRTIEPCSHLRLAITCGIHESIASRLLPALRRQSRIIKYDNTAADITSCSGRSSFLSALIPDLYFSCKRQTVVSLSVITLISYCHHRMIITLIRFCEMTSFCKSSQPLYRLIVLYVLFATLYGTACLQYNKSIRAVYSFLRAYEIHTRR